MGYLYPITAVTLKQPQTTSTDSSYGVLTALKNRGCAIARIAIGAISTVGFLAKAIFISSWYGGRLRTMKMVGNSLALTLQGIRQLFWYSTARSSHVSSFTKDVVDLSKIQAYALCGSNDAKKNPYLHSADVHIISGIKAIIGIYPPREELVPVTYSAFAVDGFNQSFTDLPTTTSLPTTPKM